jgi:hypothetical protein
MSRTPILEGKLLSKSAAYTRANTETSLTLFTILNNKEKIQSAVLCDGRPVYSNRGF